MRVSTWGICLAFSVFAAGALQAQTCNTSSNTTTCSAAVGTVNVNVNSGSAVKAATYPLTLNVGTLSGSIAKVTVTLNKLTTGVDFAGGDFMVVLAHGSQMLEILSQYCSDNDATHLNGINFTFDDTVATKVNGGNGANACSSVASGTFHTSALEAFTTSFDQTPGITLTSATVAQPQGTGTLTNTFTGDPSGTWSLYVAMQTSGYDLGTIGDGATAPWSISITTNPIPNTSTAVALSIGTNPSLTTDTLSYKATVTPAVSEGTVAFFNNGVGISGCSAVNVSGGTATCTGVTLTEGAHSITANYSGTSNFGSSDSANLLQVVNHATTVNVTTAGHVEQFCNNGGISISATGTADNPHPGTPYGSLVTVTGMVGNLSAVTLTVNNFASPDPQANGLMLVGPNGTTLDFFSYVGGSTAISATNFMIADSGSSLAENTTLTPGTYQPTSITTGNPTSYCTTSTTTNNLCNGTLVSNAPPDSFSSAQSRGSSTLATQFLGSSPNGSWYLYAVDRGGSSGTATIGSWCLNLTTPAQDNTTTTVSSSVNPSFTTAPSNTTTLTAAVSDSSNGATTVNEGTVAFTDNGNSIAGCTAQPVSSGHATCSTSFSTEGMHAIKATFGATANFNGSNGTTTQTVNAHTTVTTNGNFTSFCNPGGVSLATNTTGAPYPSNIFVSGITGTVTQATISMNNMAVGDPTHLESLLVGPAGTTAQSIDFFSRLATPGPFGATSFTIADSGIPLGSSAPTANGTYQPYSGTGTSTYPSPAPAGPYHYAAPQGSTTLAGALGGAGNGTWSLYMNNPSGTNTDSLGSWCVNLTTADVTNTTVQSSQNPAFTTTPNNSVNYTAAVTDVTNVGTTIASGTVAFTDNGTPITGCTAQPVSAGTATCSGNTYANEGSHTIVATYTGATGILPSSGSLTQTVSNHTTVTVNGASASFCNPGTVSLGNGGGTATTPYPSEIFVSGLTGAVSQFSVTLNNLNTLSNSLRSLLVGPGGQKFDFLSNTGTTQIAGISFMLSDTGSLFPTATGPSNGGIYQPYSGSTGHVFPSPAPAGPYTYAAPGGAGTFTNTFGGASNGTWSLYMYSIAGDSLGSWCVNLTSGDVTATTVQSSQNPSFTTAPNQSVNYTATVLDTTNGATTVNLGTVAFTDNGSPIATCSAVPVSGGTATCSNITYSTEGSHTIAATYSGATGFLGSNGTVTQTVNNHTTVQSGGGSTTLYCNPGPLTASTTGPGGPYPSNIFVSGLSGSVIQTTVSFKNFTATTIGALESLLVGPAGTQAQTIDFFSDLVGGSYSTPISFTIADGGASPAALTNGGTFSPFSSSVNLFPSPAPAGPYRAAAPHGTATFANTFVSNSAGNGTWSLYLANRDSDTATLANGWCVNLTTGDMTGTTVQSSLNPSFTTSPGNTVTYTATITDTSHGATVVNGGTVAFTDNGAPIAGCGAKPVSNGTALCSTTVTLEGSHTILATYSGNTASTPGFAASSGTTVQVANNHSTESVSNGTYSFCNPGTVGGGVGAPSGFLAPYPSNIFVPSLPGTTNSVSVSLNQFGSGDPVTVQSLLVGPAGTPAQSLNFLTGLASVPFSPINITISDGGALFPSTPSSGGVYRPYAGSFGAFPSPAPGGWASAAPLGGGTFTNTFAGAGAGNWSLYMANPNGSTGSWCVNFNQSLPDIPIKMTHSPTKFVKGSTGSFTITATNNGPGSSDNTIQIAVLIPTGLTFLNSTGSDSGWSCVPSGGGLLCSYANVLTQGTSTNLVINYHIGTNAGSVFQEAADLIGGGDKPVGGDNVAFNTVNVLSQPTPIFQTYVSGGTNADDTFPCTQALPCKTFAAAALLTLSGGTINVERAGDFGPVTITKPVTINGGKFGAADGIVVNLATAGVVVLKNLSVGATGAIGVQNSSTSKALLILDHVVISGGGLQFGVSCDAGTCSLSNVRVEGAHSGGVGAAIRVDGSGVELMAQKCALVNSDIGLLASAGTFAEADGSVFNFNTTGVSANGGTVRLSDSTITDNTTGLLTGSGGSITSFSNNRIFGNTTNGNPTISTTGR